MVSKVVFVLTMLQAVALFIRILPKLKKLMSSPIISEEVERNISDTINEVKNVENGVNESFDPLNLLRSLVKSVENNFQVEKPNENTVAPDNTGNANTVNTRQRNLTPFPNTCSDPGPSTPPKARGRKSYKRKSETGTPISSYTKRKLEKQDRNDEELPFKVGDIIGGNFEDGGLTPVRVTSTEKLRAKRVIMVNLFNELSMQERVQYGFKKYENWFKESRMPCTYPIKLRWEHSCCCITAVDGDTKCEVCDSADGEDTMVLCDNCDDGYHLHCISPALRNIPKGRWFCDECS